MKTKVIVEYEQGVPVDGDVLVYHEGEFKSMEKVKIDYDTGNVTTDGTIEAQGDIIANV